jgi:enoyl-CoA hydratase
MGEELIFKVEENIAILSFNRPEKRNALNYNLWMKLKETLNILKEKENIRVGILKGEGKIFSSGLDLSLENPLIKNIQENNSIELYKFIREIQNIYTEFENLPFPTIAVIQGAAIGAGLEIALCADLRICDKDAFFSIPEVQLGLVPDLGGTQRLTKIVGVAKAKELIYTGKRITATQAKEIGLVNEIFPLEELEENSKKIAEEISSNAPLAVSFSKKAIDNFYSENQKIGFELEALFNSKCLTSLDAKEGFIAKLEKRKPVFKGK